MGNRGFFGFREGAGPAGPDLPTLSNLEFWFRADFGVRQDTARTIPAEAGGHPVQGWTDASPNGYHASKATSGYPSLTFSGGKVGVKFATNLWMDLNAPSNTKPLSLYVVAQCGPSRYNTFVGPSSSGGLQLRTDNGASNVTLQLLKSGQVSIGASNAGVVQYAGAYAVTYDASGNYKFYRNSVAAGAGTNNQTFVANLTCLGRSGSQGEYLDGILFEVIKYNTAHDDLTVAAISAYLAQRWDVG
jgi:hypothetical protein